MTRKFSSEYDQLIRLVDQFKRKARIEDDDDLLTEDSKSFYDLPLKLIRMKEKKRTPLTSLLNGLNAHHNGDNMKKHHHHHHCHHHCCKRHHHHCHHGKDESSQKKYIIETNPLDNKRISRSRSLSTVSSIVTRSGDVVNPLPRSLSADGSAVFRRKVATIIDHRVPAGGVKSQAVPKIQTQIVRPRIQSYGYQEIIRPHPNIKTSTLSFCQKRTKATQTTPSVRKSTLDRSFTNLPRDRLSDILLTASIQKEVDALIEADKYKVSKCRAVKSSYDREEVRDFMIKRQLLKKAVLSEVDGKKSAKDLPHSRRQLSDQDIEKIIMSSSDCQKSPKKDHTRQEVADFLLSRKDRVNQKSKELKEKWSNKHGPNDNRNGHPLVSDEEVQKVVDEVLKMDDMPKLSLEKVNFQEGRTDAKKLQPKPLKDIQKIIDEDLLKLFPPKFSVNRSILSDLDNDAPSLVLSEKDFSDVSLDISKTAPAVGLLIDLEGEKEVKENEKPIIDIYSPRPRKESPKSTKQNNQSNILSDSVILEKEKDDSIGNLNQLDYRRNESKKSLSNVSFEKIFGELLSTYQLDKLEKTLTSTPNDPIVLNNNNVDISQLSTSHFSPPKTDRTTNLTGEDYDYSVSSPSGTGQLRRVGESSTRSVYVQPKEQPCMSCLFDSSESSLTSQASSPTDSTISSIVSEVDDKDEENNNDKDNDVTPTTEDLQKSLDSLTNISISDRIKKIKNVLVEEKQKLPTSLGSPSPGSAITSSLSVKRDSASVIKNQSDLFKLTSDIDLDLEMENVLDVLDDDTDNVSSIHSEVTPGVTSPKSDDVSPPENKENKIPNKEEITDVKEKSTTEESQTLQEKSKIICPEVIERLIGEIAEVVFACHETNEDWKWKILSQQNDKEEVEEISVYRNFLCDLTHDMIPEIFRKNEDVEYSTIQAMASVGRRIPFPRTSGDLKDVLVDRIFPLLGVSKPMSKKKMTIQDVKKDGLVGLFKKSVSRDWIDNLVLEEIVQESHDWTDLQSEMDNILHYLSLDLFDDLVGDVTKKLFGHMFSARKDV